MAASTHEALFLESIPELAYYKSLGEECGTPLDAEAPVGFKQDVLKALHQYLEGNTGPGQSKQYAHALEWLSARIKYNPVRYVLELEQENDR